MCQTLPMTSGFAQRRGAKSRTGWLAVAAAFALLILSNGALPASAADEDKLVNDLSLSSDTSSLPTGIALSTDGDTAYIPDGLLSQLYIVDTSGVPELVETVSLGYEPAAIAVAPETGAVYLLDGDGTGIWVYAPSEGFATPSEHIEFATPLSTPMTFDVASDGSSVAIVDGGGQLWLASAHSTPAWEPFDATFDPATWAMLSVIVLPSEGGDVAFAAATGITDDGMVGGIERISMPTEAEPEPTGEIHQIDPEGFDGPVFEMVGITAGPDGQTVYAIGTDLEVGGIWSLALDAFPTTQPTLITTGSYPMPIAIAVTDSQRAFIADCACEGVFEVDLRYFDQPASMYFALDDGTSTLGSPTAIALSPDSSRIYLPVFGASSDGGSHLITLNVFTPPEIDGPSSVDVTVGEDEVWITGTFDGTPEPTVEITAGELPAGLEFTSAPLGADSESAGSTAAVDGDTGAVLVEWSIRGAPTATPGDYPVTLTASNAAGSASLDVTIRVLPAPTPTPTLPPSGAGSYDGFSLGAALLILLGIGGVVAARALLRRG